MTKTYKRADHPDESKPERAARLLALNNAAAKRLGFDTMADLVGTLRAALEHEPTNYDSHNTMQEILTRMKAEEESAYFSMRNGQANEPPADVTAIMEKHPRRVRGSGAKR